VERVVPHRFEPLRQRTQIVLPRGVEALAALAPAAQEGSVLEPPEVLRHRPEGHVAQGAVDLARAALALPHQAEDLAPPGRAQALDHRGHEDNLAKTKMLSRPFPGSRAGGGAMGDALTPPPAPAKILRGDHPAPGSRPRPHH